MKKRILSILACMTIAVSMLAGCSTGAAETTTSIAAADSVATTAGEKKVLRVGMECAYAPFNWTQSSPDVANGDKAVPIYGTSDYAYGYDVMLAQKLADQLGWTLEIHKVDWSSIVLGMNSGDYDVIIAGMGYTDEREKSVDFTDPYYIRNNVMIVNSGGAFANATKLSEFAGASATTQIGTIWEQYVPQIPDVKILTFFETTSEVVMAVSMGTADCGVLDEPTAMSAAIANSSIKYVKFGETDGFTVPAGQSLNVCIAVKEGDKEMKATLDEALDAIGWDETKMTELMDLAVTLQPLSN